MSESLSSRLDALRIDRSPPPPPSRGLPGWLGWVVGAVVIGGVSFFGGVGTIYGVLLGVLILGVIGNAMTIMNTPHYMQGVITGVFLLVAIGVDSWLYRRRNQ